MSELRQLVESLRGLSDGELRSLVATRMIQLGGLEDFYALAEALNSSKSYSAVIGSLSRNQLAALKVLTQGGKISSANFEGLKTLQLVYKDGSIVRVFAPLAELLKSNKALAKNPSDVVPAAITNSQDDIDRNAGLAAFETMQALTELIFDLEKHLVREVGKGGVGLPDVKRLAVALAKPNEYAKNIFALAARLGLTALNSGRHLLTSSAIKWLSGDQLWRMNLLFENFRELLGRELASELASLNPGTELKTWLSNNFPLAENSPTSRIGQIIRSAESFGLTFDEHTTSWFELAVKNDKKLSSLLSAHLPAVQTRIILQADLSIIAPGPLPTETESLLRRFANTETIGLASTYRLSALSICHGIETGLTTKQISELLTKTFGAKLPQPVEYLLNEVNSRFGRLVIREVANSDERSVIESNDLVLLTEIGNDPRLRPFSLVRPEAERLTCRFEPSVVYFGLRECGYLAIRQDSTGKVISPLASSETGVTEKTHDKWDDAIARIRNADQESSKSGNDETITRQVQLAIRNKARLLITVNRTDGTQLEIELEPNSIANGRLRGLDRKAQVERTLPLTTIAAISLA